jgi:effector-binding domain-containing protein
VADAGVALDSARGEMGRLRRMATPRIEDLGELRYAAIKLRAPMAILGEKGPPLNREVFDWLAGRGIRPLGAPFWKYNVIDMDGSMELEVGVGVTDAVEGDERVHSGVLPAGRYAVVEHVGHPSTLMAVTKDLLDWAASEGLTWDITNNSGGERWTARVEFYETDPADEPDMNRWLTRLAFKLTG